jgi:hypothetical protein
VISVSFEIQDGVHHMLQQARARDGPLLGDVSHQKGGDSGLLGKQHELHRRLPHLADTAGGGSEVAVEHGLYGIDDQRRRILRAHRFGDGVDIDLGCHQQVGGDRVQPAAAQPDLTDGFLAGHVQHLAAVSSQSVKGLQHQCGLADAGITTDEHQTSGDQSAAEHPVQLFDSGAHAVFGVQGHSVQRNRLDTALSGTA